MQPGDRGKPSARLPEIQTVSLPTLWGLKSWTCRRPAWPCRHQTWSTASMACHMRSTLKTKQQSARRNTQQITCEHNISLALHTPWPMGGQETAKSLVMQALGHRRRQGQSQILGQGMTSRLQP
eukprot:scaffold214146_cov38-Prasinocladus_malaysianus.AAC.2